MFEHKKINKIFSSLEKFSLRSNFLSKHKQPSLEAALLIVLIAIGIIGAGFYCYPKSQTASAELFLTRKLTYVVMLTEKDE